MARIVDKGFISSTAPWADSGHSSPGDRGARESLRYRGWVLVDLVNGRYARKGLRKVRVCRLHEPQREALAEFHRIVDEIEDGDEG